MAVVRSIPIRREIQLAAMVAVVGALLAVEPAAGAISAGWRSVAYGSVTFEVPSSWPLVGYMAMQSLVAAIQKANSTDSEKVAAALLGISWDSPLGKQTIRAKDHNANRGQFWGKMQKEAKYPFVTMSQIQYVDPLPFMD